MNRTTTLAQKAAEYWIAGNDAADLASPFTADRAVSEYVEARAAHAYDGMTQRAAADEIVKRFS